MKERILTGVIGTLVACVVVFIHPIALNFAMVIVCAIGVCELLKATKKANNRGLLAASVLFAAVTPFFTLLPSRWIAAMLILLYLTVLVCIQVRFHDTQSVEDTGFVFAMTVIFSLAFSCIAYLRVMNPHGLFYVFLGLGIPWLSDIGAYFVGTLFGKRKLCPTISPKKTVEGFVGGIIVSVIYAFAASFVYQAFFLEFLSVSYWQVMLLAMVGAPLSVLGDLFASIIKRQHNVKDFGNVFPGHGGIVDRFDSLILVTPLLFLAIHFWPLVY